jgi:Zn-dependent peptidase ImmA (M78 family)
MLEIPVLGRKIGVRFISDKELAQLTKDPECLGCFDGNTVYISSSVSQEHARRVLLHEISHVILAITGLTNLLGEGHEEAICDAFESYLQLFRTPALVSFLSQNDEPGDE